MDNAGKAFYVIRKSPEDNSPEATGWKEMYCPNCQKVVPGITINNRYFNSVLECSSCHSLFNQRETIRLYYNSLNAFHVESNIYDNGDKVSVSSFFNLIDIFNKNLVVTNINTRCTFNVKTGQTYFLGPKTTKDWRPLQYYKNGVKIKHAPIKNISCRHLPAYIYQIPGDKIKELTSLIYEKLEKHYHCKIDPDLKNGYIHDLNYAVRFPKLTYGQINALRQMFIKWDDGKQLTHKLLSKIRPYHNGEDALKTIFEVFQIPQKKKLRRIIAENWSAAIWYHVISKMWNIKNYDHIIAILNLMAGRYCPTAFEIIPMIYGKPQKILLTDEACFARKLLEAVSENKVVNMVINHKYIFLDSARMYSQLHRCKDHNILAIINDRKFWKQKIQKIHNQLTTMYHELKFENIPINYTEEQTKLQNNIDGHKFLLPKDTAEIRLIGQKMHHCVGAYADLVLEGQCVIVAVKDSNDEYQACIEISDNLDYMLQAKSHYNKPVNGELAKAVKKWLRINNIEDHSGDLLCVC